LDIVQKIWAPLRKLYAPAGVPSCLRACTQGSRTQYWKQVGWFFFNPGFSQSCFPHIQQIEYFSDGCTGHYKAYKIFPIWLITSKISAL